MEVFEVHITGDESILTNSKMLGLKTIEVDLLGPDFTYIRTEAMTSHIHKAESYAKCKEWVDDMVARLMAAGTVIHRVKIETPIYDHYIDQSLYIESHFEDDSGQYPISKNRRKTTFLATDRSYKQNEYDAFRKTHQGRDLELCLFDSDAKEDADWFARYLFFNA